MSVLHTTDVLFMDASVARVTGGTQVSTARGEEGVSIRRTPENGLVEAGVVQGRSPCGPQRGDCGPEKVIFLDCDGVLCCSRSLHCIYGVNDAGLIYDEEDAAALPLETRCLEALQAVVNETGAQVVLSSTWRLDASLRRFLVGTLAQFSIVVVGDTPREADEPQLKALKVGETPPPKAPAPPADKNAGRLEAVGESAGREGRPEGGGGRGAEVRAWLNEHPEVRHFVVIDDGHVESFERALPPGHFVQTLLFCAGDPDEEGLTAEKAAECVRILKGP